MAQTWLDLLFAHWPVPPEALRPHLPAALPIDTFDGAAWIGITPFVATLRPRGLPTLLRFPELNVRTYTTVDGRPGIWFFSLDASSAAAVLGARLSYRLPYLRAQMTVGRDATSVRYRSDRADASLHITYAPTGPPAPATPGTLDHFLTERYSLYTTGFGRILRADIQHPPWPLQPATASIARNTMAPVELPAREPLLHFARRQDVLIWAPAPLSRSRRGRR